MSQGPLVEARASVLLGSKQKCSTPHYLWKRTTIPSPSWNPELLHFFLLVRRSTALMSANCTQIHTQLLTVERGFCHFAESRAAKRLRKAPAWTGGQYPAQ